MDPDMGACGPVSHCSWNYRADECGLPLVDHADGLEIEWRMEAMSHIANLGYQQMACKGLLPTPNPNHLCPLESEPAQFGALQRWARSDDAWERLQTAYSMYYQGSHRLTQGDYFGAASGLRLAKAYHIFPYQDPEQLENWHRALATPGQLFRKQRLDLADVLTLEADCQLGLAQEQEDISGLEKSMALLKLSMALREAEEDTDAALISRGYAETLMEEILDSVLELMPKLKVAKLKAILSDRGEDCQGCTEKKDLIKQLVLTLQLPIKVSSGNTVADTSAGKNIWMSRGEHEDSAQYLHRVLTGVVASVDGEELGTSDPRCEEPSSDGCDPYIPDWGTITADIINRISLSGTRSSKCNDSAPRATETPKLITGTPPPAEGARSWRLLDELRIPGTGKVPPAAPKGRQPASPSLQSEDDELKAELEKMVQTPMAIRNSKPLHWKDKSMCHQIGAASECTIGLCLNICGFLDDMLHMLNSDAEAIIQGLRSGEPLRKLAESAYNMKLEAYQDPDLGSEYSLLHGGDLGGVPHGGHPGGYHTLGGINGFPSEEAQRSERDRQLQEQLNRRSKESSGQYRDDPMVPLTLCGCVMASIGLYLARKHRRSIGRILYSWRSPRASSASSSPGTGTSISKERQAAAAALRSALSKAEIGIADLTKLVEAAEAVDVEGPLIWRGKQSLAQKRKKEKDLAEAAKSKAKAAREKETTRLKKEERQKHREAAAATKAAKLAKQQQEQLAAKPNGFGSSSPSFTQSLVRTKSDSAAKSAKSQQQPQLQKQKSSEERKSKAKQTSSQVVSEDMAYPSAPQATVSEVTSRQQRLPSESPTPTSKTFARGNGVAGSKGTTPVGNNGTSGLTPKDVTPLAQYAASQTSTASAGTAKSETASTPSPLPSPSRAVASPEAVQVGRPKLFPKESKPSASPQVQPAQKPRAARQLLPLPASHVTGTGSAGAAAGSALAASSNSPGYSQVPPANAALTNRPTGVQASARPGVIRVPPPAALSVPIGRSVPQPQPLVSPNARMLGGVQPRPRPMVGLPGLDSSSMFSSQPVDISSGRPLPLTGSVMPHSAHDTSFDLLSELSQQALPIRNLPNPQAPASASGFPVRHPMAGDAGTAGNGSFFQSNLAAIWNDEAQPMVNPFGGSGSVLDGGTGAGMLGGLGPNGTSYQPFGASSIWGAGAGPVISLGSGPVPNPGGDMGPLLPNGLGSLGWSFQSDARQGTTQTSPKPGNF